MNYERLRIYYDEAAISGAMTPEPRKFRVEKGLCPFPSEGIDCPKCGDSEFNLEPTDSRGMTVGFCDNCGYHGRVNLKNKKGGNK